MTYSSLSQKNNRQEKILGITVEDFFMLKNFLVKNYFGPSMGLLSIITVLRGACVSLESPMCSESNMVP